ncbi:MAG: TonB-dependent receptor [Deltaproteobacteria bacterium]
MLRRTIWVHTLAGLLVAAPALAEPADPGPAASSAASSAPPPAVDVTPPEVLRQVAPEYPEAARRAGLEARVTLRLDIDRDGKVTHAEVVEPQGHGFDEAALRAAEQLAFHPAERAQRPIAVRILFHYDFKLEAAPAPVDAGFEGRVAIRAPTGTALSGARIELSQNGVVVQSTESDDRGAFQLEHLPAGNYQVRVSRPGFLSLSESVQLQVGQAATVSYALEPQPSATGAIEVRVQGERLPPDVSYHRVASRELGHVAGNRGDALQALENLPGVARPPTLSGLLIVHGTSPESSQIFVDGTYVPSMYHFGGLTSVVPTDMLDHVDFFTGNYGVRYGRGNGGIVDIAMRKVRPDGEYHGLFQADLLDARVQLEGPLPATDHFRFLAGVRRSHVDLWLIPLLESQDTSFQAAPVYYDYQAFLESDQGSSHLRLGVFGSDDRLRLTNRGSAAGGQFDQATAFWNVQLLHQAQLGPVLESRTVASFGYFLQEFSVSTLRVETIAYPIVVRSELSAQLTDQLQLRFGPDLLYAPLLSRFSVPEETGPNTPDAGSFLLRPLRIFSDGTAYFRPAFFVELQARPLAGLQLIPGVRVDYTDATGHVDVSPRISAKYELARAPMKTTLKGAFGYFYEPPQVDQTLEGYGTSRLRSARALQSSLGIEQQLSPQLSLSVEGFYLDLADLITRRPKADGRLEYQNVAAGNVIGAELLLRYDPDDRFFGWLSYTLSRSERRWGPGESKVLFDFDQTHILAAVASYRLGKGWELGARVRAVSGNPATPCISGLYTAFENSYLCVNGAFQSVRSAPFYQLDLRMEKRWQLSEQAGITAYLEIINATARENKDAPIYSFDFSQRGYASSNLPLLPNLGARFDF